MNVSTQLNDRDSLRVLNLYAQHNNGIRNSTLRIASGLRINSVADNPATWAISERTREKINALDQANRNTQDDLSLVKTADNSIGNTVEILHTLRARAISAADDTNDDDARAALNHEAQQFLWQINNNATGTTFNGKKLLDGSQSVTGLNFHIGGESNFSMVLTIDDMTADALGLNGLDLSTREGALAALGVRNADGTYSDYVVDPTTGEKTYGQIDTALKRALAQQSKLGAVEERLGFVSENLNSMSENLTASESAMRDADLSKEMSQYVKYNILSQATQFMIAQMNQNAMSVSDLLFSMQ